MIRHRLAVLIALAAMSTASGCGTDEQAAPPAQSPVSSVTTPTPAGALPAPEVLTDLLYRLSDPAVPGADKVPIVEGATPADAEKLDRFAIALRDDGYLPLYLDATGIGWSDRFPGSVTADITVHTANPATGTFSFPMQFTAHDGGWQLAQDSASTVLAFGGGAPQPPPVPPTP